MSNPVFTCGLAWSLICLTQTGTAAEWPATVKDSGDNGPRVALVQSILNEIAGARVAVDGKFGPKTETAIRDFQKNQGLTVDGAVGPKTWKRLVAKTTRYVITFHREKPPKDKPETAVNESLYECRVTVRQISSSGSNVLATYRGSVLPGSNGVKRVQNGWYRLHLGLHRRSQNNKALTPTEQHLVVKLEGTLRPCLVVNQDKSVPAVHVRNGTGLTANYVHVHNGPNKSRSSLACQTIPPEDWKRFIQHFLNKYRGLKNWHREGAYRGRDIGVLVISGTP